MRRLLGVALADLAGDLPASAAISVMVVFMGGAFVEELRQPRLPPPNPPIERIVGGSGRLGRPRSMTTAMLDFQAKSNGIAVFQIEARAIDEHCRSATEVRIKRGIHL
jgi:hypothetical protein